MNDNGIIIDHRQLEAITLHNLIEEIVTRDGTDYGHEEISVAEKIARVLTQLEDGSCAITFDEASETCGLIDIQTGL